MGIYPPQVRWVEEWLDVLQEVLEYIADVDSSCHVHPGHHGYAVLAPELLNHDFQVILPFRFPGLV